MDELIERAHRGDASTAEIERLAAWRAEDAANERHYRRTVRLLDAAASLRTETTASAPPSAAAILHRHAPASAPGRMRPPPSTGPAGAGRWSRRAPWGVAATALLLLAISLARPLFDPTGGTRALAAEVVTGAGEIATVQLGDGSVVRLAPSSRLRLAQDGDPRIVALEGRAFFSIARVDGHRFQVRTRAATATVLGTRFELVAAEDDLRLVVVEGRVALEAPENRVEVGAGEASVVAHRVATAPVALADAGRELHWTGKFLAFQHTPLGDAVRELAATYGVRVVVTDSALARQTITAVFTGQTLDSVLDVVCTVVNAHCVVRANQVTISPR